MTTFRGIPVVGEPTEESMEDWQREVTHSLRHFVTPFFNIASYGKDLNRGTVDASGAINAALDDAAESGGTVLLEEGTYLIKSSLVLQSLVTLRGMGMGATTLKLAPGANVDVITTKDFSAQTGRDLWFADTGVHHRFSIQDLMIDGSRDTNTSGWGIRLYGKTYYVNNVMVRDCASGGFYSETGRAVGQRDWRDMGPALIEYLIVRNNGGNGITYRGPHDSHFGHVMSAFNTGWGFENDADLATYDGNCKINFLHCFQNGVGNRNVGGVLLQSVTTANLIVGDGNDPGLKITGTRGVNCNISRYWVVNIGAGSGIGNALIIDGTRNQFGQIRCGTAGNVTEGTLIEVTENANKTLIGALEMGGNNRPVTGLKIDADQFVCNNVIAHEINGTAIDFSSGKADSCHVRGSTIDCKTALDYARGNANYIGLSMWTNAGDTAVTGDPPNTSDRFDIISRGDTAAASNNQGSTTLLSGNTSVTVTHNLLYTPAGRHVQVTPTSSLGAASEFWVDSFTATTFDINVNVNPTQGVTFSWRARMTP